MVPSFDTAPETVRFPPSESAPELTVALMAVLGPARFKAPLVTVRSPRTPAGRLTAPVVERSGEAL